MAEHSAEDRERVGSNPTSGPVAANPGYAAFQLAKALTTARDDEDASTRDRAEQRARKWAAVLSQMLTGSLQVGSRTPVRSLPAWATLEVVTGGFATGSALAGGRLCEFEHGLAADHELPLDGESRLPLNRYFLTDSGLAELTGRLEQGSYRVGVPEEGAFLVVAWLLRDGHVDPARELLDELAPHFATLRFYSQPAERPLRVSPRVFIQDVNATIRSLRAIRPNQAIATQRETIEVWAPLYDELVSLFLETVAGPAPRLELAPDGRAVRAHDGKYSIVGGWPCQTFPSDWKSRALDLSRRIERRRQEHKLSARPYHAKSSLARLTPYLDKCVADPKALTGRDVGRIRLLLARYVTKRGLPDSMTCRALRKRQAAQARTPMYHAVAAVVIPRLADYPGHEGIENLVPVLRPISADESPLCELDAESALPQTIRRKVERCLWDTVDVLVERGLISSGDVLAQVLPQLVSGLRAAAFHDPHLRHLYAAIYQAFRRRRSLLLLNLQNQVRLEELPWIAAIEPFRSADLPTQQLSSRTLEEITSLALVSFPHAILPNKLVQELRALAGAAQLDIPLIEELAADIFMGRFSANFLRAAKRAANLMQGTLYETYYGIDYEQVRHLSASGKNRMRLWPVQWKPNGLAQLCWSRAGVIDSGYDPATNGMIIEQQQIITTQNLAPLFQELGLTKSLRPQLLDMARRTFHWTLRRLQVNDSHWHARLIAVKNSAYAWRQMLFYLSFVSGSELAEFLSWADGSLSAQESHFQCRFRPALQGLIAASQGISPLSATSEKTGPRQFLGWSKSPHWLLQ